MINEKYNLLSKLAILIFIFTVMLIVISSVSAANDSEDIEATAEFEGDSRYTGSQDSAVLANGSKNKHHKNKHEKYKKYKRIKKTNMKSTGIPLVPILIGLFMAVSIFCASRKRIKNKRVYS